MLVPAKTTLPARSLADVKGWLDDDDPFFAAVEEIERDRVKSTPRVLREARPPYGRKKRAGKHV
jgi:hypothetical protein